MRADLNILILLTVVPLVSATSSYFYSNISRIIKSFIKKGYYNIIILFLSYYEEIKYHQFLSLAKTLANEKFRSLEAVLAVMESIPFAKCANLGKLFSFCCHHRYKSNCPKHQISC